jgi:uncharacterized protein (TIGR00255 family)
MTGFGVGKAACLGGKISVEVRTVNHKYCDVKTRMPREFNPLESKLLSAARASIARGHVELTVRWEELPSGRNEVRVDLPLARAYVDAYERLGRDLGLAGKADLALLASHNVVSAEESPAAPDVLWPALGAALQAGLAACIAMREAEGRSLSADLLARIERLAELREDAQKLAPRAHADAESRLRERLNELSPATNVDPYRLAQELIFWAERADISEELLRIKSHLDQMRATIAGGEAIGRKLDFLCQELHREINTAGSKSQGVELTRVVVDFKTELEKLREQVQNVE